MVLTDSCKFGRRTLWDDEFEYNSEHFRITQQLILTKVSSEIGGETSTFYMPLFLPAFCPSSFHNRHFLGRGSPRFSVVSIRAFGCSLILCLPLPLISSILCLPRSLRGWHVLFRHFQHFAHQLFLSKSHSFVPPLISSNGFQPAREGLNDEEDKFVKPGGSDLKFTKLAIGALS
ncbi:unnamed protein product [Lactuca saligna]|uniref:Uncharacterized protein n=1 Tax=Lactuca saligna TaxID=75948 RepID=A0AA36ENG2_LACSI|nr:unnamed protein product [Lactuca saligna]